MARAVAAEGRTVFMSSHIMSEVQRTADRVGIIRLGRLVTVEEVEDLRRQSTRTVEVLFERPPDVAEFARTEGVSDVTVDGALLTCRLDGSADALVKALARHEVITISAEEPDLEALFFDRYENGGRDAAS